MTQIRQLVLCAALSITRELLSPTILGAQARIDFASDVAPILRRCQACHGQGQQLSGLRLDSRKNALQGGSSGPSVIPGNGQQSLLIQMVSGQKPGRIMPPVGEPLTSDQVRLLKDWIDQGAEWHEDPVTYGEEATKHWAYRKPMRPVPSQVKNSSWVKNPIDNFVLDRLERERLTPAPEAAKETLVRRLSLDLIGLPPPLDLVNQFVADKSSSAYERLVDRLLASPHFGEHWAQQWLDLARYADTSGYESDEPRTAWAWRDWVIDAFNHNLPFDQFTTEQIAGDLLPSATENQLVATGFHRNTLINDEAGSKEDEFYDAAVKDRVDTTGTVWLGSTLGCAQCHNHKYDPFTQRDYYRLYAIFNNTAESGIKLNEHIGIFKGDRTELSRQVGEVRRLRRILDTQTPELAAAQKTWEAEIVPRLPAFESSWQPLAPSGLKSSGGADLNVQPDGSILALGTNPDNDTYELEIHTPLKSVTGFRVEALPREGFTVGGPGRGEKDRFSLTSFEVEAWTREQLERQVWLQENTLAWGPWYEIGPFRTLSREEAFSKPFEPETNYDLLEVYENGNLAWSKRVGWRDGVIQPLGGENCARYLYRSITVREAMTCWASVGTNKGLQVWLNKKKVLSNDPTREIARDQEWLKLDFKRGKNEILVKLTNDSGKFGFYFQPYVGTEREARVLLASGVAESGDARQDLAELLGGKPDATWSNLDYVSDGREASQAVFQTRAPLVLDGKTVLKIRLKHDSPQKQHNLGHFKLWATSLKTSSLADLVAVPKKIRSILRVSPAQRSETHAQDLATYYRSIAPALNTARQEHQRLARQLEDFRERHSTTALVMRELPKARQTRIQNRGNFLSLGEVVPPGTPEILFRIEGEKEINRLTFARWLIDKQNPLTSRVRVNQIWGNIFGRGLVPTPEDFGLQGEPPSHPELLDWLATEYMSLEWNTKAFVRLIVTSAAYRQASTVTPDKLQRDPNNQLLSRGARYRVRGETVRDIALSVGGLLSPKVGGPSVFPPQPPSVLDDHFIEGGFKIWPESKGVDRHRRGLYTFYKRTTPYPTFVAFDAPDRTVCTVKRSRSNTPLQALTTLNDAVFVEAAGGLARRVVTEARGSNRERLRYAFQAALSRVPTEQETSHLLDMLERVTKKYKADIGEARKTVSAARVNPPSRLDATELAPWIVVANVLLNLDETITRE